MRTSRKTCSRDIAKNNFTGIDISQGLDLDPPSLSPHFLLVQFHIPVTAKLIANKFTVSAWFYLHVHI